MKKNTSSKKVPGYKPNGSISRVNESMPLYGRSIKIIPSVKDFTYNEFKKTAEKTPFTQA